jgi:hypothetical protein
VQHGYGLQATLSLFLSLHIHRHSLAYMALGSHPIDTLLHLSMTAIPALHRVRGGWQLRIIQKRQCLFNVGCEQFLERLAQRFEASNTASQDGQLFQRCFRATTTIKEVVHRIHDFPQMPQVSKPSRDP